MALHARDTAKLAYALPQDTGVAHRVLEPHRRARLHTLRRAGLRERLLAGLRDCLAVVHLHRVVGLPGTYFSHRCLPPCPLHPSSPPVVIVIISEDIPACGDGQMAYMPTQPQGQRGAKRRRALPALCPRADGQVGQDCETRGPCGRSIPREAGLEQDKAHHPNSNFCDERAETLLTRTSFTSETGRLHHPVVRVPGQVPRHRGRQEGSVGARVVFVWCFGREGIRAGLFITPGN